MHLNSIELKNVFPIQNFELNSIYNYTEKGNIIFRLKDIEICSIQFL